MNSQQGDVDGAFGALLTSAGGHEHEAVLLGDGGVDGLELIGPEV